MANGNTVSVQEGTSNIKIRYKIIGFVLVLMVLMVAVRFFSGMVNKKSSDAVEIKETKLLDTASDTTLSFSPDQEVDQLIQEAIESKHKETVDTKAGHNAATVKPSFATTDFTADANLDLDERLEKYGLGVYTPPSSVEENDTPPRRPEFKRQRVVGESESNPYVADLRNLYAAWGSPMQSSNGVNLAMPVKRVSGNTVADVEDDVSERSNRELTARGVKFLRVYSGTLELGYNSDTGGLMVVSVHLPGLRNIMFQAETSVGAYNERAAIQLTRAVTDDGEVFDVSGVVIDQKDRIPSISGKVDRHIVYNTIYGFGTAFLDAYAQYRTIDAGAGLALPIINTGGDTSVDTDGVLAGNAASAASRSIKQLGEFRPNTLTTKAFTTVGVVFLPEVK